MGFAITRLTLAFVRMPRYPAEGSGDTKDQYPRSRAMGKCKCTFTGVVSDV